MRFRSLLMATAVTLPMLVAGASASADDSDYAPVDRAGPDLQVRPAQLESAFECVADFDSRAEDPVLMVSGTFTDPTNNYAWNYQPYFGTLDIPWCQVTMPNESMGDIQIAGEHLVYAIREMHRRSGDKISILGHSQGGMSPRWALRFWPDVRAMVDDVIGMAPSNHGTNLLGGGGSGGGGGGTAATFQQSAGSEFLKALNSRQETFASISYTNIISRYDEIVVPGTSGYLDGPGDITNVAVQDICPANIAEHLLVGTTDPVAAALVVDALTHAGPADPARVPATVCAQLFMPGILAADGPALLADLANMIAQQAQILGSEFITEEPAVFCYAFAAGCRAAEDGDDPGDTDDQAGGTDDPVDDVDTGSGTDAGQAADASVVPVSVPAGADDTSATNPGWGRAGWLGALFLVIAAGSAAVAVGRRGVAKH